MEQELDKYIQEHFTCVDEEYCKCYGIEPKDYIYGLDRGDMLAMIQHFPNLSNKSEKVDDEVTEELEDLPEYSYIETRYKCGKKSHWKVGDVLAYYEFNPNCEGEIVLGKVTNIEYDKEWEDWLYTFEDGGQDSEESLLENQTYKKEENKK